MGWLRCSLALAVAAANALAAPAQPGPEAAAAELRDIRGPLPDDGLPPFVLTGGMLLLAGGLLLVRHTARRRQAAVLPSPAETRSGALDLLPDLLADYRHGAWTGEQLIIRLDELIRDHLSATTGIPCRSLTSAELPALTAACLNDAEQALLNRFLALGDRVKFAGHRPDAGEIDWALNVAAGLLKDSLSPVPFAHGGGWPPTSSFALGERSAEGRGQTP